ncbi:MAG: ketosteroid isomerase-related protein [Solimonas sp.]
MSAEVSQELLNSYYTAFNAGNREAFLATLTDDVVHDINQGQREVGREAFRQFITRMDRCYREQIADIVVMPSADGRRAAVEFTVLGTYLGTDDALPAAKGQKYRLPGGAFFGIRDGKVARVTNYYNLRDWLKQVSA